MAQTRGRLLLSRASFLIYIVTGIVYLFSPFDLVPEAVFGFLGLIDDLLYLVFVMVALANAFLRLQIERNDNLLRAR